MSNENRFIDGMSNRAYHSTLDISKSTLDMIERDLFAPMWARECPQDADKIKTFELGDAVHAILLEPERLKSDFVVMPDINLRTNAGKQEKKEFELENSDKQIITSDEYKKLNFMFESVMAYKPGRDIIEAPGVAERSYFWKDENTGLGCKCRPDKELTYRDILIDIKTTPDIKKFCYSVDDYRYYVQDAWYCDGVSRFGREMRMEFLVVQKTIEIGRYPVTLVKLPVEAVEYGRAKARENLIRYADFLNSEQQPETQELSMHYRFIENAMESITEVQI